MTLKGPFEEPDVGKIAIIQDPVGALLQLWHSAPQHGIELQNVPRTLCWNELNTKAPEKAASFYEKVLGFEVETIPGVSPYRLLKIDGKPVARILNATPEMGDFPSFWDVYFVSDNVDATAEKVIAAGGTITKEPFDLPSVDTRMAVLQDPQGAVFEIIKMEPCKS